MRYHKNKHINRIKILVLFGLFLSCELLISQELTKEDITTVEKLIREKMSKDDIPGLSIAIVKDGKLAWSKGYGFADLENLVPAKPNTAYRSASIGKSITATAIMQLVEQGKIDLDKPIQEYCPAFPVKKWVITTRHLLNHTSGIRHYGGENNLQELASKMHYKNVVAALDVFKNDSLQFQPGSQFSYSTYGYNVLGCIIEGASNSDFMDYMEEHIFKPSNMVSTQADNPYKIIANRSQGYQKNRGGDIINSEYVDMSNKLPAGGFITTAEDLALFAASFMGNTLVNKQTKELMLTPQKTSKNELIDYGLGWGLFPNEKWYGQREAFHGGGTPKVSGMLYLLPDIEFGVVVLMNLEGVSERVDLAAKIAIAVLNLK